MWGECEEDDCFRAEEGRRDVGRAHGRGDVYKFFFQDENGKRDSP